jgi:uncharacterized Zn finger protein (UPF0148 family)
MFCFKCGFEIKDGYKFCPKCGAPAYVEKVQSEVKEVNQASKVVKDEEVINVKTTATNEKTNNKKTTSRQNIGETVSNSQGELIPNPLIAKALDIEGVKKKAEEGDKKAIFKQAFRYKMGIGVERDIKKAEKLYEECGGDVGDYATSTSEYLFVNILSQNLCINKDL